MKAVNRISNPDRPNALALVDPHTKGFPVVYCHQSPARLIGKPNRDIVGHSIIDLLHAQLSTKSMDTLSMALVKAEEATFEIEFLKGRYAEFAAQITLSPLFDVDDLLAHMLVSITGQPTVPENQRQLAEAHLFLESAPDATFIFDEDGQMILTNREAENLFGYTRNELASKTIEELMPARYRDQHIRHRNRFSKAPTVRGMGVGASILP